MIVYNNKEYRNLQQQVKENMDDIKQLQNISTAGIKVDYIVDAAEDLADIEDPEAGQMAAVGTEVPYTIYTYYDNAWVNFGEFPMPGPEGPQGPQGERGPQGATGAQGPQGPRGFTGAQGNTGPKGDKGDTGAAGRDGTDGISPVITMQSPSVTTLDPGESATATVIVGGTASEPTYKFEFGIPRGQDGSVAGTLPWGALTGDLSSQADLMSKFSEYATVSSLNNKLSVVSSSSSYNRLYAVTNGGNQYMADIARDSSVPNTIVQRNNLGHIYAGDLWDSFNGTEAVNGNWVNQTISSSLSSYATQSWVSSQGYLTSVPSEYATQSWVNNQGFLTSIPSEYATISQVSSAISALDYASVGALSSETVIPDITGLASEGYVDASISALSSIYADINSLSNYATVSSLSSYATISSLSVYATIDSLSEYATVSAMSSAIDSVNSTISSLNYASVGALSASTYIPRVGGDNDGTYWTAITLGDDTYDIPQGGSVAWGDITGSLEDQSDLQGALDTKVDADATLDTYSSYIENIGDGVGLGCSDGDMSRIGDTNSYINVSSNEIHLEAGEAIEDGEEVTTQSSDITINSSSININSPEVNVNGSQLNPVSGVNDGSNWTELTIGSETYNIPSDGGQAAPEWGGIGGTLSNQTDLMSKFSEYATVSSLSGYAQLGAIQSFTSIQYFNSTIYTRGIRPSIASTYAIGIATSPFESAYINDVYAINTLYLSSGSLTATSPRIYGSSRNIYLQTGANGGHIYFSESGLSCALSDLALKSEIPSLSEYATISALSSAIDSLSSIYAPLSDYASTSYVSSAIASLSSVYIQPSQLASVATTGSYDDLEDKPDTEPKYVHHLTMFNNDTVSSATLRATATIVTNSPDTLTVSALRDYLYENGYNTVADGIYEASGAYYESSTSFAVLGIRAVSSTGDIDAVVPKAANVYSIPHVIKVVDIVEPLAEALGISLDWSDITNKPDLYYKDGDKYKIRNNYNVTGYMTGGSKFIGFMIPTPKLLTNIASITVNKLALIFRSANGGYVNGNGYLDYANTSGYTVAAQISEDNAVYIGITATSEYTNALNNSPINAQAVADGIELTFNS